MEMVMSGRDVGSIGVSSSVPTYAPLEAIMNLYRRQIECSILTDPRNIVLMAKHMLIGVTATP